MRRYIYTQRCDDECFPWLIAQRCDVYFHSQFAIDSLTLTLYRSFSKLHTVQLLHRGMISFKHIPLVTTDEHFLFNFVSYNSFMCSISSKMHIFKWFMIYKMLWARVQHTQCTFKKICILYVWKIFLFSLM